ncbi:hypothetical protein [Henriciella aquimarina]|uniref:hypothetical protein n=1 Tax=Henriciella aquimarina TaxID=545261 RepID=UPI001179CB3C|nr:hypothetical protein [Henriciella aquimarina]
MKNLLGHVPHPVRVGLIVVGVTIGAFCLSVFTNPDQHADRLNCLERPGEGAPRSNVCGYDINVRYCFETAGPQKTCTIVLLEPSAPLPDLTQARREAREKYGGVRTTIFVCKAPWVPTDTPSYQNSARLVDGCRKPERPGP